MQELHHFIAHARHKSFLSLFLFLSLFVVVVVFYFEKAWKENESQLAITK